MLQSNPTKTTFSLPATDGRMISSESFTGSKGLIVIFTCNHCPTAVAYEERIKAIQKKAAESGIQLLAISSNDTARFPQDDFANMKIRASQKGFLFPYCFDESQEIAKNFGAERTPHAFLLNSRMEIIYSGSIDDNAENPNAVQEKFLENSMIELLDGRGISKSKTQAVGCTIKWKQTGSVATGI